MLNTSLILRHVYLYTDFQWHLIHVNNQIHIKKQSSECRYFLTGTEILRFSIWLCKDIDCKVFLPCCTTGRSVRKSSIAQMQKIYLRKFKLNVFWNIKNMSSKPPQLHPQSNFNSNSSLFGVSLMFALLQIVTTPQFKNFFLVCQAVHFLFDASCNIEPESMTNALKLLRRKYLFRHIFCEKKSL